MLRGEPGESGPLSFTCIDATTEEVLYQDKTYQAFAVERMAVPVVLRMGEFRFPQTGWYRFGLNFAEELIAENVLHVREES